MATEELRDTLGKQFDAVAASEAATSPPPPDVVAPSGEEGGEAPPPIDPTASVEQQASDAKPGVAEGIATDVGATDKAGKEVKDGAKPTTAPAPDGTQALDHAPGTWGAEARESWKDLPPGARKEIWKREKDAVRALTISTKARKFAGEFDEMMKPYMGFIAAEGVHPFQAVNFMMQSAAVLRTGSVQQKAEMIANVIKQWGVDVELVDEIMTGFKQNGWNPSTRSAPVDPKAGMLAAAREVLGPLVSNLQQRQQAEDQALDAEVGETIEEFATKNEFFNDVREDMADILEMAKKRGVKMSLTDAYRRATLASEPVQRTLQARKTRTGAQTAQQIADKARAAAASVPGTIGASVGAAPAQGGSIREILEAQFAQNPGS